MEIRKIYEYALQREYEGKNFFQQNAGRFSHAAVSDVFEKLAAEEQTHIDFIQGLLDQLERGETVDSGAGRAFEADGFFSQRAGSELLDQAVIESMVPDLTVLRMAFLIERDFAEFYEMAAGRVDDAGARSTLEMLARWERGHEKLFKEMHDRAFQEYAGMPWG